MSGLDPRSGPDRLLGGAVSLLLAALAVYVAARLIESVWHVIAIVGGTVLFVALGVMVVRTVINRRRW